MISSPILVALPFLIALVASVATFFLPAKRLFARAFLFLHFASSLALTITVIDSGPLATAAGGWVAPFGIVLIADTFAALLLSVSSFIFICCLIEVEKNKSSTYWPLLFLLEAGVSLSFITGDLFNLFVAFELMLMSSYAILTTQGSKVHLNNAYSYLAMNITASFIYLIAIALFYSFTGELNFAALSEHLSKTESPLKWVPIATMLVVVAVKAGIFPLYFWLPDAYPILPSNLAGLFSGILSKVGIYVLFRLFLTVFPQDPILNHTLTVFACATMFFGVMGAVSRSSIPGILSYHTLSQVGYIALALSLSTPLAIAAGIFFMVHNMVVKSSLFLIGGIADRYCGSPHLKFMGGIWVTAPFLGILFIIQSFSLSALPPFSGFWGKYLLFFEGMTLGAYTAISIALGTSFFTLYSMIKIWNAAFIGNEKGKLDLSSRQGYVGVLLLTVFALGMGLMPQPTYSLTKLATEQLLDREQYISTAMATGYKGRAS